MLPGTKQVQIIEPPDVESSDVTNLLNQPTYLRTQCFQPIQQYVSFVLLITNQS